MQMKTSLLALTAAAFLLAQSSAFAQDKQPESKPVAVKEEIKKPEAAKDAAKKAATTTDAAKKSESDDAKIEPKKRVKKGGC